MVITSIQSGYDLASHNTSVARDLQFKVDSERQIFERLFKAELFTFRAFARYEYLLRESPQRNISFQYFWFSSLTCGLTSNKPTHYLLDYRDFSYNNLHPYFLDYKLIPLTLWIVSIYFQYFNRFAHHCTCTL